MVSIKGPIMYLVRDIAINSDPTGTYMALALRLSV